MPIFQNTVVSKYLKGQNKETITAKWNIYKEHFLNPTIQENIRNSKEEQYQGEFLIDLFVNVFDYTKNPTPKFNLTTEYKNVKDSKKADGAIIINEVVKAVVELKGTNTTDLSKVETQAFGYKNNQPECTYVITSNFEKLRFYIDNAIEHIEFNLFTLTQEEFKLLYLCLAYENIEKDIPKKIKEESLSEEDAITKKLYKDYSLFRRELHQSLVKLNPQYDALTLFKKTQKLLDRFLFLFFAEDRHLLPPNSVRLILEQWQKLKELDAYTPLFDRFKKYFGYLNTGFKGKHYDVYAYNGGLFKTDEVLATITIDDDLLYKHTLALSEYDFNSEVDVNILGHIFENSLSEIEEIQAKLNGQEIDNSKSKRKKDGVFYTPKYITKYIVENTVGKLCEEKKAELEIVEDDYSTDKKRQQRTRKTLLDKLTEYRHWLLQLTICDPACGSGAFLNQALDFLIKEHRYIDELQAKLFGDAMVLSDVEKSILENNLFGVDINEESVEIAKLSLWLRTAQPNRKLNDLNNNIKCGNSLIDDVTIAGEKAFKWEEEFPQIFTNGGFDVVIGNPPYVRPRELEENEKTFILNNYTTASNQFDLYHLFIEKIEELINPNGISSFIVPNAFLSNENSKVLRKLIIEKFGIQQIINCKQKVFDDASVESTIFCFDKNKEAILGDFIELVDNQFILKHKFNFKEFLHNKNFIFSINIGIEHLKLFKKIKHRTSSLSEYFQVMGGIKEYQVGKGKPPQTSEMKVSRVFNSYEKLNETFIPEIKGKHLSKYGVNWHNEYISYGPWLAEPRDSKYFFGKKILIRQIPGKTHLVCAYTNDDYIIDQTAYSVKQKENNELLYEYVLPLLNSKLMFWFFRNENNEFDGLFPKIKSGEIKSLPIIKISKADQQPFKEKADLMLSLNKKLQEVSKKFERALQREFQQLDKFSKKLEGWYELTYLEILNELKKKKVSLSLSQKAEWEDYFIQEQQKALELKSKIDATDAEIDTMVYRLYGLTDEEIEIVENS